MAIDPPLQAIRIKYVNNPRRKGRDAGIFVGDLPDDDFRPAGPSVAGPPSGLSHEGRRAAQEQATPAMPAFTRQRATELLLRFARKGASGRTSIGR